MYSPLRPSCAPCQRLLWPDSEQADYAAEASRIEALPADRQAAACEALADRILGAAEEPAREPDVAPF